MTIRFDRTASELEPIFIHQVCVISTFHVIPDMREAFLEALNATWTADIDRVRANYNFAFFGWGRDPNEFVCIECMKDLQHLDTWRAARESAEPFAAIVRCCEGPMELEIFTGMERARDYFDRFPVGPSSVHPTGEGYGATFL